MTYNESASQEYKCPVCLSVEIQIFIEILQLPVHCNLLWPSRNEAIHAPKGDIRLGFCKRCGHIFNLAFNPELMEYTGAYENSLHFSPRFQSYANSLATRLIEQYDLHGKDLIEIGCGQADFLRLLCRLGGNRGVGFDPSYVREDNGPVETEQITIIQDFYSERYADHKADLIYSRHVLEHVQFPRDFLTHVRNSIGCRHQTAVFFEVPNVMFSLRYLGIWDVIYEHYSYFSLSSLSYLFTACGFEVTHLSETYEKQFLCIEALPQQGRKGSISNSEYRPEGMVSLVATFAGSYQNMIKTWQRNLELMKARGQRAVVWGAGSKGVTFLNSLKIQDQVAHVVDVNPRKQGKYVAGTGQQIVAPEFLQGYRPDVVIIMNPIYEREIRELLENLDLTPELVQV